LPSPRKTLCLIAVMLVCAPLVFALVLARYVNAPREVSEEITLEIPAGTTSRRVSVLLAEAGLASWPAGNLLGMRLWGEPSRLKAGDYVFSGQITLAGVFDDLAAGRVAQVSVTIPEGWTAREIAGLLEAKGVTSGGDFVALAYDPASPARWGLPGPTLEGYLFPDTYRFARGLTASEVVEALVARFRAVTSELRPEPGGRGEFDLKDWVTLASVIEKETGAAFERPLIASVFTNRLKRKMRLESDPTVIYGIENFDGNIRRADLRRDTPYNTYTRKGVPFGPIASPGRGSLESVLAPATSDYLYFVSKNDGTHQFSRTYKEHLAAVRRYQLRRK
jgi:UPF0755 protein